MSGHSTTLLFALTLYFTSPKKSQRGFGVYLQTQHKTGKCGISLFSMKISAIWEIKNLEIKKNKKHFTYKSLICALDYSLACWERNKVLHINNKYKLLQNSQITVQKNTPTLPLFSTQSTPNAKKKKKKSSVKLKLDFFFPQCNMASSVMHTNIKYKYGP